MKIPYDEIDLRISLMGLKDEDLAAMLEKPEFLKFKTTVELPQAEENKKIAEFHGISVDTLISSPSYKDLSTVYQNHMFNSLISLLIENGLTDKQAYAIVALGVGLLK